MKFLAFVFAFVLMASLLVAEPGVVDTTASQYAKMQTVGLDEARWTRGFWADRFDLCRTQMVPGMERLMRARITASFIIILKFSPDSRKASRTARRSTTAIFINFSKARPQPWR